MSNKRFFGFTEFSNWVLGKVSEALATVDVLLSNTVKKNDDFGQYKVGELELSALLADLASGADLNTLQQGFDDFVAAKASAQEAITGTDNVKYLTALGAKAAIEAAVNDLVGAAPEALDTIIELSNALQNNPDVIQDLNDMVNTRFNQVHERIDGIDGLMLTKASQDQMDTAFGLINEKAAQSSLDSTADGLMGAINGISSVLGSKLDATATAVDSAKLEGSTKAQVIATAREGLGNIAGADIYVSTVDPLPTDGKDGDLWIKYTP